MKIKINLNVKDVSEPTFIIETNIFDDGFDIELTVPVGSDLSTILTDEYFRKGFSKELESIEKYDDDFLGDEVDLFKQILMSKESILSFIQGIYVKPYKSTIKYMQNNPIIEDYPIVLNHTYSISYENLEKINGYFKTLKNFKLCVEGNRNPISIKDYEKTINSINDIVSKIKKYDLSPLEQVMYAYDLVRDRVYVAESKDEDPMVSRDLTSVLLGDKIVCVGYANILDKVLKNLGIKSQMFGLDEKNGRPGHERNMIYIKDDKYSKEAVYFLDPTFDSKRKENDTRHLDSYNYFCRTKGEIDALSKKAGFDFIDKYYGGFTQSTPGDIETILEEDSEKKRYFIKCFLA